MPRRFLALLRARITRDYSIAEFARRTGIPRQRLSDLLNGTDDLTGDQWRRLWEGLRLTERLWTMLCAMLEE